MKTVLNISNLTMDFGGLRALDNVDLRIESGQIVALIGPNGAGKTTLFNCITGIYNPTKGNVELTSPEDKTFRLNGLKPNTRFLQPGQELMILPPGSVDPVTGRSVGWALRMNRRLMKLVPRRNRTTPMIT